MAGAAVSMRVWARARSGRPGKHKLEIGGYRLRRTAPTLLPHHVGRSHGTARVLLDRPFNGWLPAAHRLDLSLARSFNLPFGKLQVQAGAINAYDRHNMFYHDLYTGRRVDQLPLAPYAALTLRGADR